MMKRSKRFCSYLLITALLCSFCLPDSLLMPEAEGTQQQTTSDGQFNYSINADNSVTITQYNNTNNADTVVVPAKINGRMVTGIGYCDNISQGITGAFQAKWSVQTVFLPDTLQVIGDSAFSYTHINKFYTYNNSSFNVSGNASSDVSGNASGNASGDASENASGNTSSDASGNASSDASGDASGNAFSDASGNASGNASSDASGNTSGNASGDVSDDGQSLNLNLIMSQQNGTLLPANLQKIGANAFHNTALTDITMPASIQYIGDSAFVDSPLTSFTLPEGANVAYMGHTVFRSAITSITLYGQVTTIADNAFSGLSTLVSFYGTNVGDIGAYAFENTAIKTFTIEGSLNSIGDHAFKGCGSLETVVIHSRTPYSIGAYAFDCASLKNIELSNGITIIEEGTFSNCGQLETVLLPESLTNIEKDAFQNVSTIQKITIGDNVIVDKDAFEGAGGSTLNALSTSTNKDVQNIVAAKTGTSNPNTGLQNETSNITTNTPAETPVKVKKVTLKSAKKNKGKTKVTLKWKKASNISGYTIYVKAVSKGKKARKTAWKKCKNTSKKKTSATLKLTKKQKKLLKKGGTLYYSIKAYKTTTNNGTKKTYYSAYSNTKKIRK